MSDIEIVHEQKEFYAPEIRLDPQALIAQAIEKGTPVDTMERLLAMFEKMASIKAKGEFVEALARFQSKCPVIKKEKEVYIKGELRYKYAPLDSIVSQIQQLLFECGFSYTIETEQTENSLTAICIIHHVGGHDARSSFTVPVENNQYKSAPQHVGSARTYAMRYALCDAFGILTGDEDNDGNVPPSSKQNDRQEDQPVNKQNGKFDFTKAPNDNQIIYTQIIALLNLKYKGKEMFTRSERIKSHRYAEKNIMDLNILVDFKIKVDEQLSTRKKKIEGNNG